MGDQLVLFKRRRMKPVMVRLPNELREQARDLADAHSTGEQKFTESDVYRTAISSFLSRNFTDSKDSEGDCPNAAPDLAAEP